MEIRRFGPTRTHFAPGPVIFSTFQEAPQSSSSDPISFLVSPQSPLKAGRKLPTPQDL